MSHILAQRSNMDGPEMPPNSRPSAEFSLKNSNHQDITILNAVASLVRQSSHLDRSLNDAFCKLLDLMELEVGSLFLMDENRNELNLVVHLGLSSQAIRSYGKVRPGENTIGDVVTKGKPVVMTNLPKDSLNKCTAGVSEKPTSFASVPLKSNSKVLGVINVASPVNRQLTTEDIRLLTSTGRWMASIIQNNKDRQPNSGITKIVEGLREIAQRATNLLKGQGALVTFKDPYNEKIRTVATFGADRQMQGLTVDVDHKLTAWILDNRSPLICPNIQSNSFVDESVKSRISVQSIVAVPIFLGNEPMGAIMVFDKLHRFNHNDAELLTDLANQVLKVISNRKSSKKFNSPFSDLITKNQEMKTILRQIEKLLDIDIPVLIEGESGTGKELVAKALHYQGQRRKGAFLAVNCGALPETLLEAELFGHKKGSFTDAIEDREGIFETATRGTVFLDEVSEMSPGLQAKLLRVLQEREIKPIGEQKPRKVDVRVISASNKNLENLVNEGKFREDLFYRLNVVRIQLPPLRERKEDIPLLARHFLYKYAKQYQKRIRDFSPEAMHLLLKQPWKGNVRELENEIERAVAFVDDEIIGVDAFSDKLRNIVAYVMEARKEKNLKSMLSHVEKSLILNALKRHHFVKKAAAKELGVSRPTLDKRIAKYKIH